MNGEILWSEKNEGWLSLMCVGMDHVSEWAVWDMAHWRLTGGEICCFNPVHWCVNHFAWRPAIRNGTYTIHSSIGTAIQSICPPRKSPMKNDPSEDTVELAIPKIRKKRTRNQEQPTHPFAKSKGESSSWIMNYGLRWQSVGMFRHYISHFSIWIFFQWGWGNTMKFMEKEIRKKFDKSIIAFIRRSSPSLSVCHLIPSKINRTRRLLIRQPVKMKSNDVNHVSFGALLSICCS